MSGSEFVTAIESIATGNPELSRSQTAAADFMEKIESTPAPIRNRIRAIYERSGIDTRYSCIADYDRPLDEFEFYPPNWKLDPQPSTGTRNTLYKETVVPLGCRVAQDAITSASINTSDITHVITVSCTGFFAPGLDIELCGRLGLSSHVERVHIGFMGCYAAFNALKTAHAFCQADSSAVVLIVCVELCTLHFQVSDTMEKAVINSLFSDGAAAAVLRSQSRKDAKGKLVYRTGLCALDDDSRDHMTWEVGDIGFNMGLSRRVPEVISTMLPAYIEALLEKAGKEVHDVDFWAIHPGGRAVVEKAVEVLDLDPEDTFDSTEVLRLFGNMSSPTILFILARFLRRNKDRLQAGSHGVGNGLAMAFGPGLTIEGCFIEQVQ
jgi:predicted naringenin-chalcone synthase